MSFVSVAPPNHDSINNESETIIEQVWWPDISISDAREILRLTGTVTDARLFEALQNAVYSINDELKEWSVIYMNLQPVDLVDSRLVSLYKRAVYFYAKAELTERYRDFDTTGAGERRADKLDDSIDESRRIVRWAISDIIGKPRLTVGVL